MTVSNTASQLQDLDPNSLDPNMLLKIILQQNSKIEEKDAQIKELESRGKADPGNAWLNTPGPNFRISEAQKAKGFWTVTDMIMDQDYKKGDIMTITLWKPKPGAKDNAIGSLSTQPKWTGEEATAEEPAATDDDLSAI